jgi:hypothetical protein
VDVLVLPQAPTSVTEWLDRVDPRWLALTPDLAAPPAGPRATLEGGHQDVAPGGDLGASRRVERWPAPAAGGELQPTRSRVGSSFDGERQG